MDGLPDSTPVIPLAIVGVGAWLAWFGVHYWRSDVKYPTDPVKAVLTGKPMPSNAKSVPVVPGAPLSTEQGPGTALTGATGGIAARAQSYVGAGYNWGGVADKVGNWDCSSFVSYVLGHDFGLVLPGGGYFGDPGYPPHSHGPGSTQYMLYGAGIRLKDVVAGDLIVSTEHIGIAVSPTEMVSAQQPSTGTAVGTFPDGFPAGPPVYRRITSAQLNPVLKAPSQM